MRHTINETFNIDFNFYIKSPILTKAEDIRDFQIEGISIGDSLLDYYTENEIISFIQDRQYPNSQRVKITKIISDNFETYEAVSADFLNDGSYRIIKLSGRIFLETISKNVIKKCLKLIKI